MKRIHISKLVILLVGMDKQNCPLASVTAAIQELVTGHIE